MSMTANREALEDAFTRAEGAQEIAFRAHERAKKHDRQALIAAWMVQGQRAHREVALAALKLSTYRNDDKECV